MKKKNFVLNEQELNLFIGWHKYYLKEFGQIGWHCEYFLKAIDNCYAKTFYNLTNKTATIYLSPKWPDDIEFSAERLQKTAKHEVQHLVTAKLYMIAINRFSSQNEVDAAEEELVRLLDKIIPL